MRTAPHLSPRGTAMLDQLDAASADAARILAETARRMGTEVRHRLPSASVIIVLRRLTDQVEAGQLTRCPHLDPTRPEPTWWAAWAPGRIRCRQCLSSSTLRIKGTREDRRCDCCRRIVAGGVHSVGLQLPAALTEIDGFLGVWPPVTATFGLCDPCLQPPTSEGDQ